MFARYKVVPHSSGHFCAFLAFSASLHKFISLWGFSGDSPIHSLCSFSSLFSFLFLANLQELLEQSFINHLLVLDFAKVFPPKLLCIC